MVAGCAAGTSRLLGDRKGRSSPVRCSLHTLGPVSSKVERESASIAVVEFHGRYLAPGHPDEAQCVHAGRHQAPNTDHRRRPPSVFAESSTESTAEGSLIRCSISRPAATKGSLGAPPVLRLPVRGEPVGESGRASSSWSTVSECERAEEARSSRRTRCSDIQVGGHPIGPASGRVACSVVFRLTPSAPAWPAVFDVARADLALTQRAVALGGVDRPHRRVRNGRRDSDLLASAVGPRSPGSTGDAAFSFGTALPVRCLVQWLGAAWKRSRCSRRHPIRRLFACPWL